MINKQDDSNKENLEKRLGDDTEDSPGNVTSLTRRMKSVRNFFAGSGGSSTTQPPTISSGLVSVAITANAGQSASTTPLTEQQLTQQQNISTSNATSGPSGSPANNIGSSASAATSGAMLTAPTGTSSDSTQPNLLQRQDTQTNLGSQSSKPSSDTTASNQLDLSDVPSALESQEIINQDAESLNKLREHKRVVKVQLEMDRELAALRKKHNKQLEKEITTMNQKRDKLMACQTKQRSLLAKTHSKLSRKSVSSDKNLMKRQSEQNLQTNIAENQAKLDELHRTTAQSIMTLLKEQIRVEQDTFERYHEKLFAALEKTMVHSQNEQLDRLQSLHDSDVQMLMGRLNCQSKESIANFASAHKDKNEFARVKRELQQRLIDLAVSERQRFELLLERRRTELIAKQEQIKNDLSLFKETQYQEKHTEFLSRLQQFQISSEQNDLQQFIDLVSQNCSRSSSARSSFTMSSGIFSSLTGTSSNSVEQQRGGSGILPMVLNHATGNKRRSLVNLQHSSSCENESKERDGRGSASSNVQIVFVDQSIEQTSRSKHSSAPDLDSGKTSRASIDQQSIMNRIQEERPASTLPETTENSSHLREKENRHLHHRKKRSPSRTKEKS